MRVQRARTIRVVLKEGDWVQSPRTGAWLRIALAPTHDRDELSINRVLPPGTGRFPEHVHLDFAETFVIEKGVAEAELAGDALRLRASKPFHVPRGVPHVNPYNPDTINKLEFTQSFRPATEGARSYVQTLERALWHGRDDDGELPPAVILAVGDVTREHTYLTGPRWRRAFGQASGFGLQRRWLLPLGRLVAGTRGFELYLTCEPEPSPPAAGPTPDEVTEPTP